VALDWAVGYVIGGGAGLFPGDLPGLGWVMTFS
jgi:hypothetical protein